MRSAVEIAGSILFIAGPIGLFIQQFNKRNEYVLPLLIAGLVGVIIVEVLS